MLDWLNSIHYTYLCFTVGICIAMTCSLLSTYIVLRRMSLISEGISHAGYGGIGIALVLGFFIPAINGDVYSRLVTGVFCLGAAFAINAFTRGGKVHEDS